MHIMFIDYYSETSFAASVYLNDAMLTGKSVSSYKQAIDFLRGWLTEHGYLKEYIIYVSTENETNDFQLTDIWDDECVIAAYLTI